MSAPTRTLVLLAHPDLATSRVNRALADAVRHLPDVTVRELASVRGSAGFDVAEEQRLLEEHERIVWQFPWYWYSVPALLKEWMDQVLTRGFAYGGGDRMQGKHLHVVTSTGGPDSAYRPTGHNRFTMAELMRPLEATAHLCGMVLGEPLVVHGARTLDGPTLATYAAAYRALLVSPRRLPLRAGA